MSYLHLLRLSDGTAVTTDRPHYQTHQGQSFMTYHNSSNLGAASSINIYLKTPTTTPLIHMTYNVHGSASFDFEVLEAPTVTSNTGTNGVAVYNKYRDSGTTSSVSDNATSPATNAVGNDVTVTADGTIIRSDVYGTKAEGADFSPSRELILKANTAYVFRLTAVTGSNRVHINLDWYED